MTERLGKNSPTAVADQLREEVKTIGQLAALNLNVLSRVVGQKFAAQIHGNANGVDNSPVETEVAEAKSYSAERTFREDICDGKALDRELFKVAVEVALGVFKLTHEAQQMSLFEDERMEEYRQWDKDYDGRNRLLRRDGF